MRKRRTIILVLATVMIVAVVALVPTKSPPVLAAALGRGRYDDGSVGFTFAVTNKSTQPLEVMVARTDLPTSAAALGFAYRIHTTMQPMATWYPALYPPPEGVSWSADVLYLRQPGKLERALRAVGARFRLCKTGSKWERVQRIEIPR